MFHKHFIVLAILFGFGCSVLVQWPSQQGYAVADTVANFTTEQSPSPVTAASTTPTVATAAPADAVPNSPMLPVTAALSATTSIYQVPFYSQFADITSPKWEKVGCGITSLAMLVDYYGPAVPVDSLLQEGIDDHAYLNNAGWTYAGLIEVGEAHGITGQAHDLSGLGKDKAFGQLEEALKKGPVMVGVRYLFEPDNPIPHLVIADGIKNGRLYYNDPAGSGPGGSVTIERFKSAWRGRYIEFWPLS